MNKKIITGIIILILTVFIALPAAAQRFSGSSGSSSSSSSDTVSLTVQSNVRNAQVRIESVWTNEGRPVFTGTAPFTAQLDKGDYKVTVSAPGYGSVSQEVRMNQTKTININLAADTQYLTVTSNVAGARVIIRGPDINGAINGNTSFTTELPPGTYKVRVNAPGYFALDKDVNFSRSTTVDFQLQPKNAQLQIIIPDSILDYSSSNPAGRITVYDNGSEVSGNIIDLNPGQHTIRIVSGGLAVQQTINVRAGEVYSFMLDFGLSVTRE